MDYTVTNPGIEQLDILEEEGADPSKVIIGHAFVKPQSVEQIIDICKRGANVQVDHLGIPWRQDDGDDLDGAMIKMMCEVADRGYLSQMTITYDRWFFNPRGPATADNPQLLNEKVGLGHLFESFAPRLAEKGSVHGSWKLSSSIIRAVSWPSERSLYGSSCSFGRISPGSRLLLGPAIFLPAWAQQLSEPTGQVAGGVSRRGWRRCRGAGILATALGEQMGQSVVVENVSGAGGTIGTARAAHATPDGYTLLVGTPSTHGSNVAVYPNLEYDPVRDFAPVMLIGTSPFMLLASICVRGQVRAVS